jgi:hypothetical protein
VLNAERTAAATVPYWDGDLDHFSTRASRRDGGIAATVLAQGGHARAWMNLMHVPAPLRPLVWLRLQWLAARTPFAVLYASDLAPLSADDGYADPADAGC